MIPKIEQASTQDIKNLSRRKITRIISVFKISIRFTINVSFLNIILISIQFNQYTI